MSFLKRYARATQNLARPLLKVRCLQVLSSLRVRALSNRGNWVVQPYFYSTRFGGLYNNNWRLQSAAVTRTNIQQTYLMYGLTSRIDIEVAETRQSSSGSWRVFTYLSKLGASMPRVAYVAPSTRLWTCC